MRILRSYRKVWLVVLFLFLTSPFSSVEATTGYERDATCPVCGHKFRMFIIPTLFTTGVDTDFLGISSGYDPVTLATTTCPKCYYSGWSSNFLENAKVSNVLKSAILEQKILKPMIDISMYSNTDTENDKVPPWVTCDLIAQQRKFLGDRNEEIGDAYLWGSWAVRHSWQPSDLERNLGLRLYELLETRFQELKFDYTKDNSALAEIDFARELAEKVKDSAIEDRKFLTLSAISLYRKHGENREAKKLLVILKEQLQEAEYKRIEEKLLDSIDNERFFQKKALVCYVNAIDKIENPKRKATITYLCGEINRRLENWDKAKDFFKNALEMKETSQEARAFIKRLMGTMSLEN